MLKTKFGRPEVEFDAANEEHRKAFSRFLETGSWGTSPYRFKVQTDGLTVVTRMNAMLIEYYTRKEFACH
jgi:hypothetical protein